MTARRATKASLVAFAAVGFPFYCAGRLVNSFPHVIAWLALMALVLTLALAGCAAPGNCAPGHLTCGFN
ncbi:MAG: hypothetical protein WB816_05620 [Methylocystis sp.]